MRGGAGLDHLQRGVRQRKGPQKKEGANLLFFSPDLGQQFGTPNRDTPKITGIERTAYGALSLTPTARLSTAYAIVLHVRTTWRIIYLRLQSIAGHVKVGRYMQQLSVPAAEIVRIGTVSS